MIKLLELFGGIGACSKALKRLGVDYKVVDYVEIDKYAVKSYNAINGTNFEPQDITEWDKDIDVDLIMHGSPCQDFSLAGSQAGGDKGSGTRSSLMYETVRIVEKLRPKVVIWENVKNLLSKKHKHNFDNYIETMDQLGYNSYYKILNSKHYGIPQNRERVFTISIRKDVDTGKFEFPKEQELKLRLKDMLEDEVDEKYYLSEKIQNRFKITDKSFTKNIIGTTKPDFRSIGQRDLVYQENSIMGTLVATDYKQPKQVAIKNDESNCNVIRKYGIFDDEKSRHQAGSVYDVNGLSPTLDTMQGGYRQPLVTVEPKIETYIVPQTVSVRKYKVNCNILCKCLRDHKLESNFSNKEIAEQLNIPITKVEHWFRRDGSFAIPDSDIWFQLKKILGIETNEFDESIMTFEEREGVYEKSNRVYGSNGLSPTITSTDADIKIVQPLLIKNAIKKGYLEAYEGDGVDISSRMIHHRGTVQKEMIQTLDCQGGNSKGVVVRCNDDKKDKVVCEQRSDEGIRFFSDDLCGSLRTIDSCGDKRIIEADKINNIGGRNREIIGDLRIRKLTPLECWRLMGFDDEDLYKAEKVNSNTQLYKQCGNSIVVNVMYYVLLEVLKAVEFE